MDYVKDRFLDYAYRLTGVGQYYEEDTKQEQRLEALQKISLAYEQEPKLANILLCKKIAELSETGAVNNRVIAGRWHQLTEILDLYKQGKITDIGLTANITRYQKNDKGAITSSQSLFVHDRGEGRLEFKGNRSLTSEVQEAIAGIDNNLPREKFFAAIKEASKELSTNKTTFYTEISEYLFIDGKEDSGLLDKSPNSFLQDDCHADQDERPEEYRHFHDLLRDMTAEQLHEIIKNCGLGDEAIKEMVQFYDSQNDESQKQMVLQDLKKALWSADREDFYRELARLDQESGNAG